MTSLTLVIGRYVNASRLSTATGLEMTHLIYVRNNLNRAQSSELRQSSSYHTCDEVEKFFVARAITDTCF